MKNINCDSCGEKIKKRQKYCLRIELFSDPKVELDEGDVNENAKNAMKEIIERVKELDAKKLEEEVYICYDLILCKQCRDKFAQRVKYREFI
ncbi:MAG: hypothetical protein HY810_10700 [Candidatus Omnitrophica bacterium]|nr:hypothetical protein [Candidatus Omnitrophota bacterium]